MPDSIDETRTTRDGTIVYWCINADRVQRPGSIHADHCKLSLSIKASDSNVWEPEVEFYPQIDEVAIKDADGEPQVDKGMVNAYLFKATDGKSYARNWRIDLFAIR